MTSIALLPVFVGLELSPPGFPLFPVGDQGIGADLGEAGSLVEVPLPPRRPAELGGRLVAGASQIYDFQNGFYGRRTGTPTPTTTWRCKDTFTSGPSPWALTSGQEERLRKIAAQLSGCYGIDLQHAFTTMNIESKFAHDTMLNVQPSFKGPFQYSQTAYRDAFKTKRSYSLNDLLNIDKQCRAFAIDTIRFPEILKRKGITPEPWMLYMMHQQGWPTAPLIIKKSIDAPETNLRAFVNRINRRIWGNIINNPQFSATISASSTVLQLCNIFKGKYISNRDGTGGFQPVTDYIEQVSITVPIGAASGQIALADIIRPAADTPAYVHTPGVGLDLRGGPNRPQVEYLGVLAKALVAPNKILMMEFEYAAEDRYSDGHPNQRSFPLVTSSNNSGSYQFNIRQVLGPVRTTGPQGNQEQKLYLSEYGPDDAHRIIPFGSDHTTEIPVGEETVYSEVDFDAFAEGALLKVVSCGGPHDYDRSGTCYAFTSPEDATHRVWDRNVTYAGGGWPTGSSNTVTAYIAASGGYEYILPLGDPQPPAFENGPTYSVLSTGGDSFDWNEGLPVAYGAVRIAWRRTSTKATVAINGGDPVTVEAAFAVPDVAPTSALSVGKMVIKRILEFPDNPDPQVLTFISDATLFKVGTEPELEPSLPS